MNQPNNPNQKASFAYDCAAFASKAPYKKEYKSYCKNFPSMVLANGLAAAMAFVYSKRKSSSQVDNKANAYKAIYSNIFCWFNKTGSNIDNEDNLMEYILNLNSQQYRHATSEVLSLFEWLRRFAEGMIEGEISE